METGRFYDKSVDAGKVLLSSKSASSQGNPSARYKVICIGDFKTAHNGDVCLGVIGYGPTICIRKNCQKNHLGGSQT
jgi:hypothetical protein